MQSLTVSSSSSSSSSSSALAAPASPVSVRSSLRKLLFLLVGVAVATNATNEESLDEGIFDWVRSAPGGIYHEGQVFRKDPATGVTGVFAKQDIPKGTILVSVPWSHVIPSINPHEEDQLSCGLVRRLRRELEFGQKSFYAPYIEYVKKTTKLGGKGCPLPTMWSRQGKALFQAMLDTRGDGEDLPPEDPFRWLKDEWFNRCGGIATDKLGIQAALIVIQRSDDAILIPGYDMYNHRNGKWLNTETSIRKGERHVTVATRDIQAGEQIYISYNMCRSCFGRWKGYGTADIMRDYGFLEMMPQRFHYDTNDFMVQFEVDEGENGTLQLIWDDKLGPSIPERKEIWMLPTLAWFRRQIRRLRRLRNIDYRHGNVGNKMPQQEWDLAWSLQMANIQAMTLAMESLEQIIGLDYASSSSFVNITEGLVGATHLPHYDPLGFEPDDMTYTDETCNHNKALGYGRHNVIYERDTHYQKLSFFVEPETKDVLMELDNAIQVSSRYRPHYHEFSVHAAARFLDSVKRVIFIGGGDSMLLHEVLKYPELELVVGLELDQTVTRKSFQYFHTQPHFDDPRVEWWFGDATKSLLLLPKDYWQSFDLVLVDLSETVMSLSVTAELDVFDALALLLKPEGILVKNEQYMRAVSQVFDYSIQIVYESPVICDQVLTMGSNKVDFFHAPVKDHGVETLLYTPLVTGDNRHDFLHDYRHNDARGHGKCSIIETEKPRGVGEKMKGTGGIMEIVEAEQASKPLDEKLLVSVFELIAQQEGFHLSGDSVTANGMFMIFLEEGYILARLRPDYKYCSMDINLWGKSHNLKALTSSLIRALGSELVSSYRVVVGGMYGSSTSNADCEFIGPPQGSSLACSKQGPKMTEIATRDAELEKSLIEAALDEIITTLVGPPAAFAVVLCGTTEEDCLAKQVLDRSDKIDYVVHLATCSDLNATEPTTLYDCEIALLAQWKQAHAGRSDIFILDATAPKEMLQVVNSILHLHDFSRSALSDTNVVLTWSFRPDDEPWREQFLDRFRKQQNDGPVSRAGYRIESESVTTELGVVSAGDASLAYNLERVETRLQKQFPQATIELHVIHGGKYKYWIPWKSPTFLQSDYNDIAAFAQYAKQKPTAQHSIFQLESIKGTQIKFDQKNLKKSFDSALGQVKLACSTDVVVRKVGEGCVMVCLNAKLGTAVLTWDGRDHVDISYQRADLMDETELDRFITHFRSAAGFSMDLKFRDNMPRGMGRVVNTPQDADEHYTMSVLGSSWNVEEGSCSAPGADPATCWPEPPRLDSASKATEGSCSAPGADGAICWPEPPKL